MVSQTFLSLTLKLGGDGTFWLYAAIAAVGMAWVYCALPETNGKPCTRRQVFKQHPVCGCGGRSRLQEVIAVMSLALPHATHARSG